MLILSDTLTITASKMHHQVEPAVSLILCAHRNDGFLKQAIESCLNQTFTDFELIIICNGDLSSSISDEIKCTFGEDQRLRVIITDVEYLTFSLTLGLHFSRSKLVARMDADDISHRDRLASQVEYMKLHPEVIVLGTSYEIIDEMGVTLKKVTMPETDSAIRRQMYIRNPICHPSVMFRKDKILKLGGYLGGIYAQDYDLWCRIAEDSKVKFANLPDVYLKYRSQGVGGARRNRIAYSNMAATQYRNFVSGAGSLWLLASVLSYLKCHVLASK